MYNHKPRKIFQTQETKLNKKKVTENPNDTTYYHDSIDTSKESTHSGSLIKINKLKDFNSNKLENNHNNFVFGLVLFALIIFAWTRFNYIKRLKDIFNAFTGRNFANQFIREGNFIKERIYLPLMIFSLLSYSLMFIYCGINIFDYNVKDFARIFLFVFAGVLSYWLIKTIIIRILAYVFRTATSANEYILNMHVFFIIGALAVFPFTVFSIYVMPEIFSFTSLIILSVIFISWLIRALRIGMDEKCFLKFHLFLYLCTLEFLPLVLLAKIILKSI